MTGAAFILAINLLVAGLFCATFVAIALYDRRYLSARWFALTYAAGMAYAALEFLIPAFTDTRVTVFLGHTAFLATLLFLNIGIARRYGVETPRSLLTAAFAVSLVVSALIQDLPRESLLRMVLYQAPYSLMQAIGMAIVLKAPHRRLVDTLLAGFLGLSALHYLSKPLVAVLVGGVGDRPQDYLSTTYAMVSQSMGAVLVVATGLLLLAMLIADVLRDVTRRSETDPLSGLLNRRGFEDRLGEIMRRRSSTGLPVALVLCDLDHFKQVNDTYGHAIGDRLIAEFAASMRKVAADHQLLGRIGGEEFAAVLPGSNLAAGRLFAEAARAAYAQAGLDSAVATRFTASFGVSEMIAGETAETLMARADAALYEAKRSGRDCVRVSRVQQIIDDGRAAARSVI